MPPRASILPLPELVPEQEFLTSYVSTVIGPVEFRVWKKQLERINEMLGLSEVEKSFQRLSLGRRNEDEQREAEKENRRLRPLSVGEQASYQRLSSQVLRCNVAQTLLGEDFRGFSCRLAESELLQWFCKLDRLEGVRIPGKSTLQLPAGPGRRAGSGVVLSGHDVREIEHPLSGGLGAVARRGADADESDEADSQAWVEGADGGAGGVSQADEPVVHEDDARAAEEGRQADAQGGAAGDEEAEQNHRGARRAAP